jgi:CHAD domain-containing protein
MTIKTSSSEASRMLKAILLAMLVDAKACESELKTRNASVHDIRVAIRRIRSTLKAYRKYLGEWSVRIEYSFKTLAKKIDLLRDSEAQISWLLTLQKQRKPTKRAEIDTLIEILTKDQARSSRSMQRNWIPSLKRAIKRLEGHLKAIPDVGTTKSFDVVFRKILKKQTTRFCKSLKKLSGDNKTADLHAIRIQGKQLRYLIDPFTKKSACLRRTSQALQRLQNSLGNFHDIQIFKSRYKELRSKDGRRKKLRWLGKLLKNQEKVLFRKAQNTLSRKKLTRTLQETISTLKYPIL